MPGNTARLQIPYPVPDDEVDVPADIKRLADKLDVINMPVTIGGGPPSNPVPGTQYYDQGKRTLYTWDTDKWQEPARGNMEFGSISSGNPFTVTNADVPQVIGPTLTLDIPTQCVIELYVELTVKASAAVATPPYVQPYEGANRLTSDNWPIPGLAAGVSSGTRFLQYGPTPRTFEFPAQAGGWVAHYVPFSFFMLGGQRALTLRYAAGKAAGGAAVPVEITKVEMRARATWFW